MGRFLAITTPIMYLSFFAFSTSLFAAEALTNTIVLDQAKGTTAANQLPIGYIVLIGLGILTILISINFFSHHFGTGVAKYTSFAKFLPLFTIIIMGIFFGFIGGTSNFFNSQTIPDAGGKNTFSPTGILKSCPAIMFSFDGFLIVGSITNKINNSKRNIPLAILIAMAFSAFVYILITTAEIILGVGNAFEVFEKIGIKSNE
jgi:amino acid transporter